jgi:hypothetical protein
LRKQPLTIHMILSKVLVLFKKKKKKGLKDLLPISQLFQTKTGSYTIRTRLIRCNSYYTVIRISITKNKRSCNVITIIIHVFGDNT